MKKKIVIPTVLLLLIIGVLAGVKTLQINAMVEAGKNFSVPPEIVSSAEVRTENWESTIASVGSVTAVQGIQLKAEVAGTVSAIEFESGAPASKGKLLVQLDTSSEQAQLRSAEAQAELARLNLERARDLRRQDLIAQSDLDTNEARFRQTNAEADNIRAAIAKKTIRAPFTGQLGIRLVNLGQFVNVGDPIVSLQSLDPVYVDFTLPEQQLAIVQREMPVRVTTDVAQGRTFTGRVTALNPEVDAATRNVKVQATFPNHDGALRPGVFARVELVRPETKPFLVIPSTAVLHAPYGDSVFVIGDVKNEKTGATAQQVRMTTVRLGATRGDFIAVTDGLEAGQKVVSAGVFKLRNGTPVVVDNTIASKADSHPQPADS